MTAAHAVLGHLPSTLGDALAVDIRAAQAALAQVTGTGDAAVALRFELVVGGMEIANGYQELADPDEQRRRFEADRAVRRAAGQDDVAPDERLLAALRHGITTVSQKSTTPPRSARSRPRSY